MSIASAVMKKLIQTRKHFSRSPAARLPIDVKRQSDKETDTSENITFSQTTCGGGNEKITETSPLTFTKVQ